MMAWPVASLVVWPVASLVAFPVASRVRGPGPSSSLSVAEKVTAGVFAHRG